MSFYFRFPRPSYLEQILLSWLLVMASQKDIASIGPEPERYHNPEGGKPPRYQFPWHRISVSIHLD
jgi:hypothetical protein